MTSSPRAELLGDDDVSDIVHDWDGLAERLGLPYCSPYWLLPWRRHVAPERVLRCVAVFDGNELVGVAPFFGSRERGVRTWRLASVYGSGAPKEPLAAPGRQREVASAVARCLVSAPARPGLLAIDGMPATSPWARALAEGWQPAGRAYREFSRPLTWIDVEGRTFDEWLDAKGAKTRKGVRRLRRRLEEQGATFRVATTPQDIDEELRHFVRLHLAQWSARGGSAVVTGGTAAMLRAAAAELATRSRMWVSSIQVDGDTIASEVFVRAGPTVADWLGGFDEAWSRFSPGMLVMMSGIEHATTLHASRVEFGAGRQPFKHRLSDGQLDLEWALVVPPGPASLFATSLSLARVGRRRGAAAVRDARARLRPPSD